MKRILLTTIISSIGVMFLFSIYGALVERDLGIFIYLLTLGMGNIIAPTFGAVLTDRLISHFVKSSKEWKNLMIRMILLGISMLIGLWIWAIIDVKVYYGSFQEITYERVIEDFNSEFFGWLRVAFMLMIAIPLIDREIKRRIEKKTFANST